MENRLFAGNTNTRLLFFRDARHRVIGFRPWLRRGVTLFVWDLIWSGSRGHSSELVVTSLQFFFHSPRICTVSGVACCGVGFSCES